MYWNLSERVCETSWSLLFPLPLNNQCTYVLLQACSKAGLKVGAGVLTPHHLFWELALGTANVYKNNLSVQACPSLSIKAVFSPFKCLYSSKHPKICPYLSRDQIILKYHPLLVQEKSRLVQSFPEKELNFHIMANQGQTYCLLSTFNYCVAWVPHSTSWSGW